MRIDLYEDDIQFMQNGDIAIIGDTEPMLMVMTLEGLQHIVNEVDAGRNILIVQDGKKTLIRPNLPSQGATELGVKTVKLLEQDGDE